MSLKRIEERHSPDKMNGFYGVCQRCTQAHPCDVVWLARALAAIVHPLARPNWDQIMTDAERALKEVAGD